MRKKYSRRGLIQFFARRAPQSKPCRDGRCPIATYMDLTHSDVPPGSGLNYEALQHDPPLATAVDTACYSGPDGARWGMLTAAHIVRIAKSLPAC